MILGPIAKIVAGLYSNRRPGEVGAAVATAVLLTIIPGGNLLWFMLLFVVFLVRINHAVTLVLLALLAPLSSLLDPLLHGIGHAVLTHPSLAHPFTQFYALPLAAFTRFNNTVVMGGLLVGMALWIPLFLLACTAVLQLRQRLIPAIAASKPVRAMTKVPLIAKFVAATRYWSRVYQAVR